MGHKEHMKHAKENLPCAVITISDSRTEENDVSGTMIMEKLEEAGHEIEEYSIIPDQYERIHEVISNLLEREDIKVIITNGGTGITDKDVTVEAVLPLLDKVLPGFGEIFRFVSYQEIGSAAIMSRAFGGTASGTVILCLPGSTGAVTTAMDKIVIPQLGHMILEVEK